MCPGNHDVDRDVISTAIIESLNRMTRDVDVNEFVQGNSVDYRTSINSTNNYFNYFKSTLTNNTDTVNELYTIQRRKVNGVLAAIVSLNTSWLSNGQFKDEGNLLFPVCVFKDICLKISDCDVKILLTHHPLSHLREFNYRTIDDIAIREFDIHLCGHTHREKMTIERTYSNGLYVNTANATLNPMDLNKVGYSVLEVDVVNTRTILVERARLITPDFEFAILPSIPVPIFTEEEREKKQKLRNKIFQRFEPVLESANSLLLNYDPETGKNFLDIFTSPILSKKSATENGITDEEFKYSIDNLLALEANYIIYGKDKCGKTSLLKRIELDFLKNFAERGVIPFFIDYKDFLNNGEGNIDRKIARSYEISHGDVSRLRDRGQLLLLVDNLNPNLTVHEIVHKYLLDNPGVKFIIGSEDIASRVYIDEFLGLDSVSLYFKDLGRREIRLYTEKLPNVKIEDRENVQERIANLCKQLQLPMSYWTISLITLIYKKQSDDYHKNLFSILDLCVDEILSKKRLALAKGALTFEQYKDLCSFLAYTLFVNHRKTTYSADYSEIILCVDEYVKRYPRIVLDSKEIFDHLNETGILKSKDGRWTFRLNGIFEYFLAYYMKENEEFKDEVLSKEALFLTFKNELEIYSGFNRKDEKLLQSIYDKTAQKFAVMFKDYSALGHEDGVLVSKIGDAIEFEQKLREMRIDKPLTTEAKEGVYDTLEPITIDSDVHLKDEELKISDPYEYYEKYLSTLARVYKNIDHISDTKLVFEIFEFILQGYIYLSFYLLDEAKAIAIRENLQNEDGGQNEVILGEELLRAIGRFMPLLAQIQMYDGLGHMNLRNVIQTKIDQFEQDSDSHQYKLFVLYFLLIDLDVKSGREVLPRVFRHIRLPALKVSTYFKLNFYLAFKTNGNRQLEQFYKNAIQDSQMGFDNAIQANTLQRGLSDKQKGKLKRKNNR